MVNRALRLLPALAVVLVALAFVAGPVLTERSLANYFTDPQAYGYVPANLSLLMFVDTLPGVFTHNPFPEAVDGSLWTLMFEVRCYLAVLCLGLCGALNRYVSLAILLGCCVGLKMWLGGTPLELYACFAAGAVWHHWRPPLRGWIAAACLALCAWAFLFGGFRVGMPTVGTYVVMWLALDPRVRMPDLARHGDLSYGTYIWAFFVQQCCAALLGGGWAVNLVVSVPVVLGLAYMSWHFIEAPTLALKARFRTVAVAHC